MNNFFKITGYTITDQMRHKSFYVLLGISILFVLMIRGCYSGDYSVNGKNVDNVTLAWHASKIIFQVISYGMFLMAAMLSMKIFSRDQEDGSMVLFLSRPVLRWQYVSGRIAGTWILCLAFMFILHLTIFLTVWAKTGGIIPDYLTASLVSSTNLLFIIVCVSLFSLYMPDFISAIFTIGLIFIGFVSDGGFKILSSEMAKLALTDPSNSAPALWRVLYPKVFMVQAYAGSIISKSEFVGMGPVNPLLNLSGYILVLMVVTLICFNRKEI